jgi:hypothetical protein
MILTGCKTVCVKTVKSDSFCEGKYYPQTELNSKDFQNLTKIRQNEDFTITIDKFVKHLTINEKEFKQCKNLPTI